MSDVKDNAVENEEDREVPVEGQGTDPGEDFEGRARRMGWKPLDEFRGDRNKWVDAEAFVKTGENELPVLKDRLRQQDRVLLEQRQILEEMRERNRKAEERGYKRAREQLEAERRAAVQEGNTAEFERAEKKLKELEEEQPSPSKPVAPQPSAHVQQFIHENSWFTTDAALREMAIALDRGLHSNGMTEKDRLEEVARRVKLAFPDKFQQQAQTQPNARRAAASPVSGATAAPSARAGERSFANLPPEAKAAFQKWKRQMPNYTEKEYVADYDWD